MITQAELKEILNYDPSTGVFTRKVKTNNRVNVGDIIKSKDAQGYLKVCINYKIYYLHRLAWFYIYGVFPKNIDHINRDKTDNRLCNLREVTLTENNRNLPQIYTNTSGVTGVYWESKLQKWRAFIHVDNKKKHLGVFKSFDDAVLARKQAERDNNYHINHGKII